MPHEHKDHKLPKRMNADEDIRTNDLVRVIKQEKIPKDGQLKDIAPTPRNYQKFKGEHEDRKPLPRGLVWGVVGIAVLFVGGFILSFFFAWQKTNASIPSEIGTLQAGIANLQNFDPQSAQRDFASLSATSSPSFSEMMGVFGFLFQGGNKVVSSIGDLTGQLSTLSGQLAGLESGIFDFASTGQGANLISGLATLRNTLAAVDTDTNGLSALAPSQGNFYLPFETQVEGGKDFLDAFIPWLSAPTPHHFLVILQDPSDVRPAGGFLDSYADITIAGGNITNVSVHPIADVDAAFKEKIIPPQPLQLGETKFRPADANWFFDFPTSASETIALFQQSNLYADATSSSDEPASTTFDGAIAISPTVISDLLSILASTSTSSMTPTASTTVAPPSSITNNFNDLSPAFFAALASSTPAQQDQLLSVVANWVADKDLMVYFKDPALENFFLGYGATGDVYQLPQNFNGDYFAVVDADAVGGQNDLAVAQKVALDTEINADGTITDDLTINRANAGKTANLDYLQLFVVDGSSLTNETGGIAKNIVPPLDYIKNGYSTDPLIAAIQSSTLAVFAYPAVTLHEESGKEVFSTWSRTGVRASTTIEFDYTHRAFVPPGDGVAYQFVFEQQAGVNRSYDYEIDAPLGYAFKENNLATYEYTSDDPPGRLVINLTLEKI